MYIRSKKDLTPLTKKELDTAIYYNHVKISKEVKRRRIELGYNLNDLSALCGISKQTLYNVERFLKQEGNISLSTITRICLALGCSIYDLLNEEDSNEEH